MYASMACPVVMITRFSETDTHRAISPQSYKHGSWQARASRRTQTRVSHITIKKGYEGVWRTDGVSEVEDGAQVGLEEILDRGGWGC